MSKQEDESKIIAEFIARKATTTVMQMQDGAVLAAHLDGAAPEDCSWVAFRVAVAAVLNYLDLMQDQGIPMEETLQHFVKEATHDMKLLQQRKEEKGACNCPACMQRKTAVGQPSEGTRH